ncbi:unnamed protein product [Musa textilis]
MQFPPPVRRKGFRDSSVCVCVCLSLSLSLSLSLPAGDEAKGVDRSIDPVMGSGDLLGVEPLELKFPFELNKQISCSVQLSNKTEDFLAFKVKTTNPRKYCVRPNVGIILPRSTCDVVVTMQAQREAPPEMQCKDKFLLQSIATSSTTTLNDITQEMFSKEPGKIVDEVKIQVAYVSPPQPLSNVYEQSEEGGASPSPFGSDKAMALISRLTEEKNSALQQNSKLRQEVELMRREIGKRRGGLSMSLVLIALLAALVPESVGGSPKAACLLLGELDVGYAENAAAAELRREAEEHLAVVGNAVESVGEQRNRVDSVLVAEKGSGEARHRVADGPGRVAFEADDLVRAVDHRLPDPLQHSLLDCRHILRELAQYWHSPHAYARPQRHRAVPVLPHHRWILITNLDILSVDLEVVGEQEPEARGVEIGAGSDHPIGREAGQLPRDVRQHVHRIRHHQQQRPRGVPGERRHDLLEQGQVALQEVEARLPGDLPGARRDDADVGVDRHRVVRRRQDPGAGKEGGGVLQVQHLPPELVGLGVHQRQLVRQVLRQDRLRDGHADVPGADHGDLRVALRRGGRRRLLDRAEQSPVDIISEAELGQR